MAGWLPAIFLVYRTLKSAGTVVPQRSATNFVGGTVTDDPANDQTIVGLGGGGLANGFFRSSATTTNLDDSLGNLYVVLDTTDGSIECNLPANPTDQRCFVVIDGGLDSSNNPIDINGNGHNISGQPNISITDDGGVKTVLYDATAGTWYFIAGTSGP